MLRFEWRTWAVMRQVHGVEGNPTENILQVEELEVRYGDGIALVGVSFEVKAASATAILGPNGAGKSTLARALAGLIPVTSGRLIFMNEDISAMPPHKRRRMGLAYLPEERGIFPSLTVTENLRLAVRLLPKQEKQQGIEKAFDAFPVLKERAAQRAATLSGGEQQMLALGRIISVQPELVVADEISLGLAPRLVDDVFLGLEKLRDSGAAVVLIEQFVERALSFSDHGVILRNGSPSWVGAVSDVGEDVLSHYLGRIDDH
jgi:branched-chain amino acid transport system ATP-binding protein